MDYFNFKYYYVHIYNVVLFDENFEENFDSNLTQKLYLFGLACYSRLLILYCVFISGDCF